MSRYKLFIGHLSPDARTRDLERFFKDHGFSKTIQEVVVKTGYGFVVFDDRRDADDAIYELNGKELMGARLQVEYAKPSGRSDKYDGGYRDRERERSRDRGGFSSRYGRPYNTDFRLVIENVSTRCSWQDIKDYFRQAGEVTFAKCHREKMGEGVVEFASSSDMKNALRKLDGSELFGKRIKLISTYRGQSESRSRSRSRSPKKRTRSPASRSPVARSRSRSPRGRSRSRSFARRSVSRSRSRSR
ncbi:serine/arginine-rich splicing factor 5 isoform X1 [Hydra vulgaris]|uniref:Serine/arginine-rich splicing factor 5 isoform X2 n=1 Tax=Hydra vulgaris TaxID=6087 RepID=A0ABM4C1A7_HYDVU|nr:serine/arginine-rich splicing factor 5 [Hydra vulgaris]